MGLMVNISEVPVRERVQTGSRGSGAMKVQKVSGKECSVMIAERMPGYHTRPHYHDCEQINYVLEGEIWFFIEDQAFLCRKGDFHRIPRNKIHWAWNNTESAAVVLECHAPPLGVAPGDCVELLAADEEGGIDASPNIFVEYDFSVAEAKMNG